MLVIRNSDKTCSFKFKAAMKASVGIGKPSGFGGIGMGMGS